MMDLLNFTPVPELNEVLDQLVKGVRTVMGEKLVGAYLGGSYAHGGWHTYSDVDFDFVIREALTPEERESLKVVHARIFAIGNYYARHLEGAYFPTDVLADLDRTDDELWYLDNGSLNFERSTHDNTLVNRWVLRNKGVVLTGPQPDTLIPLIPEDRLKAEVRQTMRTWGGEILDGAFLISNRFWQAFVVQMYCRMLQSLETGEIGGKPAGAAWAMETLDPEWIPLIEDAMSARENQYAKIYVPADPEKVARTIDFVCYTLSAAGSQRKG
jgi:predicted nucleotidyltransferase